MNGLDQMDRLHQIGIAGQPAQRGSIICAHALDQFALQRIQISKGQPRHLLLEILPDPFGRVHFWISGWLEDQPDIRGNLQAFGCVCATVIQHQEIKGGRMRFGELVKKQLHLSGIQRRQQQEKVLTSRWCNAAIHPTVGVVVLDGSNWFDAFGRNPAPPNGMQPEPTFILGKHLEG